MPTRAVEDWSWTIQGALNFRAHSMAKEPKLLLTSVGLFCSVGLSVYNNRNMHEIISQFAGKYSL